MKIKVILAVVVCVGVVVGADDGHDHEEEADLGLILKEALAEAKNKVNRQEQNNKQFKKEGVDDKNKASSNNQLGLFSDPKEGVEQLAKLASIEINTVKKIINITNLSPFNMRANKKYLRAWKKKFQKFCEREYKGSECDRQAFYRTANGTCNNFQKPTWGSVFCPQLRFIPPMYDDTVDSPRQRDSHGYPLPSPRFISNMVHRPTSDVTEVNTNLTVMVMQWGQFIDHEFISTPILKGEGGTNINCCGPDGKGRPECFPIQIPSGDPYFGKSCMNFVRSAPAPNKQCNPGFREQLNQVTSFIDGSAVYGSSDEEFKKLRSFMHGLLKTGPFNLLPKNDKSKCVLTLPKDYCQLAGDGRVNVVPSLGFSHTTFMREHNRIAYTLHFINPHWDDETLFQQARKIVAAELMHINYNEYLPAILNEDTLKKYNLRSRPTGYHHVYRRKANPSIANVFGVAAFRFGHSQIPNHQAIYDENFKLKEKRPIEGTYHNPHLVEVGDGSGFDGLGAWLTTDFSAKVDRFFESGYQDKLFLDKDNNSFDLAALNIMRGRDHGIPPYNHWRVYCKLPRAKHFHASAGGLIDHDSHTAYLLERTYVHIDDIDLFTGAISEKHLPGSAVGPTFACLLGKQFKKLKIGDRFWYENRFSVTGFTEDQLNEIKKVTLAKVLCDNSHVGKLQPNIFHPQDNGDNQRIACKNIPGIDLTKWKACEFARTEWPQFDLTKCRKKPKKSKKP